MIHIIIVLSLYYQVYKNYGKVYCKPIFRFPRINILYEDQFGFTPSRNTTDVILSLVDYIINSLENNNISRGIVQDIFKAFDTIDHSILLRNLSKYGIALNVDSHS